MSIDTIFALSSGTVPSGVAIIRFSGPGVRFAFETMIGFVPKGRIATLRNISSHTGDLIDRGLSLFFQSPGSFTGEDCGEFHVHGGRAVLDAVLIELGSFDNFRMAEPGEFSRRAFENGKMDLTEVEGLSDLIVANTKAQHNQALMLSSGVLSELYSDWRTRLTRLRAFLEAEMDFSEEEDVLSNLNREFIGDLALLSNEISRHLETSRSGEIIKDGFKVALMGPPNSGKSSLLNALAKRDVAIVSEFAGTTRDVISVNLNIGGYEVVVSDTAGIRETSEVVESIGIRRALDTAKLSNLTIWLDPLDKDEPLTEIPEFLSNHRILRVSSKSDLVDPAFLSDSKICFSVVTGFGLDSLDKALLDSINAEVGDSNQVFLTRHRHWALLSTALGYLVQIGETDNMPVEIIAEHLRLVSDQLGKVIGKIDVEDMLDVIFSEFCVGK